MTFGIVFPDVLRRNHKNILNTLKRSLGNPSESLSGLRMGVGGGAGPLVGGGQPAPPPTAQPGFTKVGAAHSVRGFSDFFHDIRLKHVNPDVEPSQLFFLATPLLCTVLRLVPN